MKMAQDAGIDTSLPRGRRQKTAQQKRQEQENRIQQMRDALTAQAQWRYNTWRQRPEVCEQGQSWRPVQDRDLDTYYCRLKELGLKVSAGDVKSLIFSRDFCPDYDAFREWLDGLKPWNPDTDPDYLSDFYVGHLEFGDPENEPFYDQMLKKWHVGMVALMLGRISENPQMPIFKGLQHIGKTYFVRHILPPELSDYRLEVGPSERIDKDFIISLSETPLILFDEISFGSNQKSEAFKYIPTRTTSSAAPKAHDAISSSTSRTPSTSTPSPCPTREPTPRHSTCSTTVFSPSLPTTRASSSPSTTAASRSPTTARKPYSPSSNSPIPSTTQSPSQPATSCASSVSADSEDGSTTPTQLVRL